MDFVPATDRFIDHGVSLGEIGRALGVSDAEIEAYRTEPDEQGHRQPPAAWRSKLAALARKKGGGLTEVAQELEE